MGGGRVPKGQTPLLEEVFGQDLSRLNYTFLS